MSKRLRSKMTDRGEIELVLEELSNLLLRGQQQQLFQLYLDNSRDFNNTFSSARNIFIDWDCFVETWQSVGGPNQVILAETVISQCEAYLLHLACIGGAPDDVISLLLKASSSRLTEKCGMGLEATPLHLACFYGATPESVELLLEHDKENIALFSTDVYGHTPLHITCQSSLVPNPTIVQLLLKYDVSKKGLEIKDRYGATPLQLASQFASEQTLETILCAYLEADRMESNEIGVDDIPKQRPLHLAFHHRDVSSAAIVRLLSTGAVTCNLHMKDRRGQVPLHVACQQGARASAFKQLIDNDKDGSSFQLLDCSARSPADILINRILDGEHGSLETLHELSVGDADRRFFKGVDKTGKTFLDKLVSLLPTKTKHPHLSANHQKALHVSIAVTPPGAGDYTVSLARSRSAMGQSTFDHIYNDPCFHKTLNSLMSERSFAFFFMVDLYVRIILVVSFTIATNDAIQGNVDSHLPFVLVYLTSVYLFIWQMKLIWYHQLYYLQEVWNLLDLVTVVLVFIAVAMLHSGKQYDGAFRALNVLVGGLVWFVIVTGALRSTFLPFAVFVSGFCMILLYMIPFGTTTFLMLGAFADMYFKTTHGTYLCDQEDGASDFCTYDSSLLKVYAMFVGGIDGSLLTTQTEAQVLVLSVFYAFNFSIVMLNVLVAVIFDAWGRVSPRGHMFYWRFRHRFLIETTESKILPWSRQTCCNCSDKLEEHLAAVIQNFRHRPDRMALTKELPVKLLEVITYMFEAAYLVFWFALGLLTASLLWPHAYRRAIFASAGENGGEAADEPDAPSRVMAGSTPKEREMGEPLESQMNATVAKEIRQLHAKVDELHQILRHFAQSTSRCEGPTDL